MHLSRFKQHRKGEHNNKKKFTLESGNEPAPSNRLDNEGGIVKKEDIKMKTFPTGTEQPQGAATEETDEYFQDPTTIGKHMSSSQGNP